MAVRKGVASQPVAFYLEKTNFIGYSGLTDGDLAGFVKVSVNGGTPAAVSGTITEVDATNMPGVYSVPLSAAEVPGLGTTGGVVQLSIDTDGLAVSLGDTSNPIIRVGPTNPIEFQVDAEWDQVLGTNYSSTTDTLAKIREYFDTNLQATVLSGLPTTELSGTGWLSRIVRKARQWADSPGLDSKYQQSDLIEHISESSREIFEDVLLIGESNVCNRYSITLVDDQQDYVLPPNIGLVLRVAKIDSASGRPDWVLDPSTHFDPYYYGFVLEGNLLRLTSKEKWDTTDVVEILYMPNGDFKAHKTTVADITVIPSIGAGGTTITSATAPTDGSVDARPNAYAGAMFTLLSAPSDSAWWEQTIPIESSSLLADGSLVLTLRRPLNPIPTTGAMTYEVTPLYARMFEDVLALHIARSLVAGTGSPKKLQMLTMRYREKARALRLSLGKVQIYSASRFDNRTDSNYELGGFWRL